MTMKSTPERYGSVALILHWASAGLILSLIPLGFAMQRAPDTWILGLYRTHAALGLLAGLLTVLRLVWWLGLDRKPVPPCDHSPLQRRLATTVHTMLYGAVLALTISGIGLMVVNSLGTMLVTGDLSLMPADLMLLPPRLGHGVMARLLIALLILHVLGALYHHWIRRDGTLSRMRPRFH
jgi:cytochrome b561